MDDWKHAIAEEWARRRAATGPTTLFPLIAQTFGVEEVLAAVDCLLSNRLTMAGRVDAFEKRFAETVGAPYAVMVNSGSSANLLAVAAAANPARAGTLRPGDEVLVPAVCWPTSLWPIVQSGLKPVFVDVDPATLNVDLPSLERAVTPRTRAMVAVHILGNSAPMRGLTDILAAHKIMLIEDTCESLGSRAGDRWLGTFGDFGTFSFYYSHHITTGEGGMVVCKTLQDYDLLRCLRSHGWSRNLTDRQAVESEYPDIDPRFLFVNSGYNLRPTDIQGAFGLVQLGRLETMNAVRGENKRRLTAALMAHPNWRGQLELPVAAEGTEPAWFGFPCLLEASQAARRGAYIEHLTAMGVESRPLVSGNFLRQPAIRLHGLAADPANFPGAEAINHRGFFIGLHTEPLSDALIGRLVDVLLEA